MTLEAEEQIVPWQQHGWGDQGCSICCLKGGMGWDETRFCSPRLQCWWFWEDLALAAGRSLYNSQWGPLFWGMLFDPYFEELLLQCDVSVIQCYNFENTSILHLILPSQQLSTCSATDLKSPLPARCFFSGKTQSCAAAYSYVITVFEPRVPVTSSCIFKSLKYIYQSSKEMTELSIFWTLWIAWLSIMCYQFYKGRS